ncbi:MAG: hypothetical protein HC794_09140 [Nitrospiraceae bacterium]|nr:hypothetical protein [Nitrospiraceae bacterium]
MQKNPAATINLLTLDIDSSLPQLSQALMGVDLLIAATDNNRSRFNLNALALEKRLTMLVGRATTRAAGGDVLRVRPYQGPCYACLFGAGLLRPGGAFQPAPTAPANARLRARCHDSGHDSGRSGVGYCAHRQYGCQAGVGGTVTRPHQRSEQPGDRFCGGLLSVGQST